MHLMQQIYRRAWVSWRLVRTGQNRNRPMPVKGQMTPARVRTTVLVRRRAFRRWWHSVKMYVPPEEYVEQASFAPGMGPPAFQPGTPQVAQSLPRPYSAAE